MKSNPLKKDWKFMKPLSFEVSSIQATNVMHAPWGHITSHYINDHMIERVVETLLRKKTIDMLCSTIKSPSSGVNL